MRCSEPISEELPDEIAINGYYVCVKCIKHFLGPEYVDPLEMEVKLPVAEGEMIPLKDSTITQLIKLEILDKDLNITPNAVVPAVLHQPLSKQCEMLGVRLIHRRPTGKKVGVEEQMSTYLVNRYGGFADESECYWLKRLFGALIEGFDASKIKKYLTDRELKEQCAKINKINDTRIVYWYEQDMYSDVEFHGELYETTKLTLRARYNASKSKEPLWVESKKQKEDRLSSWRRQIDNYVYNVTEIISLWHSLTPNIWSKLTWTAISDWVNMRFGWPDLMHVDRQGQLRLIEIKRHGDKLHKHQIYVLQKLLSVLGEDRLAVIEVGGGYYDNWYRSHSKKMDEWFKKKILDS